MAFVFNGVNDVQKDSRGGREFVGGHAQASTELMTVKDLAATLRVSARQCWKLLSSGRLPGPVRLGRSVRWRAADVALFVQLGCDMAAFEAAKAGEGRAA